MTRLMEQVDPFVLLTEHMKAKLPIGSKPYTVVEGIADQPPEPEEPKRGESREKYIVDPCKINEMFGVKALVDGFMTLTDPDCRLVLCGKGDCEAYAREMSQKDPRILVMGQQTPRQARQWQSRAAALVNPRGGSEEYTKYSFPSKNIEYLLSGKPVVSYFLAGMPPVYRDFMYCIDPQLPPPEAIARKLEEVLRTEPDRMGEKNKRFFAYAGSRLRADSIAKSIVSLNIHRR